MPDPTNADLICGALAEGSHGQTYECKLLPNHDGCHDWDTTDALEQAGKELAGLRNIHAFDLETIRVGKLANEQQAATIEAVLVILRNPLLNNGMVEQAVTILSRSTPTTDAVKLDPEPDEGDSREIVRQMRRYLERFEGGAGTVTTSQRVTVEAMQGILDGETAAWAPSDAAKLHEKREN